MTQSPYYSPRGGLPPQSQLLTGRAAFTPAYAVIPRETLSDITASLLPFWQKARFWVLARPLSGFAETFSQYIAEIAPGGGSDRPETERGTQAALFVLDGVMSLGIGSEAYDLGPGGYAHIPPDTDWRLRNAGEVPLRFHWFRKRYAAVEGLDLPPPVVLNERDIPPDPMPGTNGVWATTRFTDPADLRHDMHVNIVTFQPGGVIPFEETHVMEHGIYVLEGKAVYRLNRDWIEVQAGDYIRLRAFCPQACYAGGPGPFRYLLYKDVNRHMPLTGSFHTG